MAYQRGIDLLHEIDTSRSARLAEALAQGQRALADNDVKSAMTRFEYALAIEPDNQQATLGLTRAQARGNVLDLMQDAWEAEQQGDLASALAAYEQANVLDGDFAQAAESVQRVAARINKERFHTAMSEAVGALDARQFKTAQKALAIAAQLQPDDASVQDLRQRLQRARKRSAIASLRKQAQQQIAAEDWQAASRSYKKALTIDPAVAFALDGKRLAHERIRLHQQLDHYLSEPTRLYSAEPLANAEQLLAAVDKVPENEPSLASKIATLRRHVAEAQTPVTIELHSDGLTDVVIYHVGRPGRFMQQQIELRPGTYILLGSRPGYRDVRKQIEVRPQMVPKVVRIRCEEMI
jgi:tetratricopeptide (TPR) repeat protein